MNKMDNRGQIFSILIFAILGLIVVYALLYLPFSSFAPIRSLVNYFLIVIVWIILQVGFVYGYYRLWKLGKKGFSIYKNKIQMGTIKVQNFLLARA